MPECPGFVIFFSYPPCNVRELNGAFIGEIEENPVAACIVWGRAGALDNLAGHIGEFFHVKRHLVELAGFAVFALFGHGHVAQRRLFGRPDGAVDRAEFEQGGSLQRFDGVGVVASGDAGHQHFDAGVTFFTDNGFGDSHAVNTAGDDGFGL